MKIICIAKNYSKHAKELGGEVPDKPVFFMKPDSAIITHNRPFYMPAFSNEIHHEVEIVVKINRLGKKIQEKFAHRYYDEIGIGIDFTARDLQREYREKGYPWEIAKAFDGSAVLGKFVPKDQLSNLSDLPFSLTVNDRLVQVGNTKDMVFAIDHLIAYVSQFITLKIGDLLFTGTPEGVGPVHIGDRLKAFIQEEELLNFLVK
jgi:acylpyruvate hydrolase